MAIMKTLTINGVQYQVAPPVTQASVTLKASKWVADGNHYSQVVDIKGVTPRSQVDPKPSEEQLSIFHDKDLAFSTKNVGGVVTVTAIGELPTDDHTIQVSITEVEV